MNATERLERSFHFILGTRIIYTAKPLCLLLPSGGGIRMRLKVNSVSATHLFTVARSYSGLPWEGVNPAPLQPECQSNGDCILRTTVPGVYRVDNVTRGLYAYTVPSSVKNFAGAALPALWKFAFRICSGNFSHILYIRDGVPSCDPTILNCLKQTPSAILAFA